MGNVGYLLDTHVFLWAVRGSQKLSTTAERIIEDTSVQVYVSAISAYEIMSKHSKGKLSEFEDIAENYFNVFQSFGAEELSIKMHHMHFAGKFEWSHRDPFDRFIAAQAFIENLTLITSDSAFHSLPWITVIW